MSSIMSVSVASTMSVTMTSIMSVSVASTMSVTMPTVHMSISVPDNLLNVIKVNSFFIESRISSSTLIGFLGPLECGVGLGVVGVSVVVVRVAVAPGDGERKAPEDDEHHGDARHSAPRRNRLGARHGSAKQITR